jgi:hypothetical protein
MILWLSVVGAVIVIAVAVARMLRRNRRPATPPDVHWGDWPPDQMAP